MPKRTKTSSANKGIVAILLMTLLGGGVLAGYVRLTPQAAHVTTDRRQSEPEVSILSRPDKIEEPTTQSVPQTLLIPTLDGETIKLGKDAGTPPEGVKPEVYLVNATLQSLELPGARAVGVDIKNHIAMMDFNPSLQKGYGSIEEGNLVKSLQMALGQFKDINKFQIVIEGKAIDTLGNIDLSEPIPVIRPGVPSDN